MLAVNAAAQSLTGVEPIGEIQYTAGREKADLSLLDILLIAAYIVPLIGAASHAEARRRITPLLAILTLGLVNVSALWRWCAVAVRRLSNDQAPAFDPDKPIHRTAAFLMILGILNFGMNSMIGDVAGEVESLSMTLPDAMLELVGMGALHLAAAFLGVGWLMRRRLPDVLSRLCLRPPTLREASIGIAVGAGLFLLMAAAISVWQHAVPAEVFERQTEPARLYFSAFSGSITAALLLAVVPAVSEEIFYRGALQPVFGILLTSIFFTATHQQYALTPAAIILFFVSLGFAWLRLRYSTSAAILAHAVYNFLPFLTGM